MLPAPLSGADPTRMANWTPNRTGTAAAAWLVLTACAAAFAQETSPLHATLLHALCGARGGQPDNSPPAEVQSSDPQRVCRTIPIQLTPLLAALVVLPPVPASAKDSLNPPEEEPSEKQRPISYGVEIELGSGHADRGFVLADRPVVQPVIWVSGSAASFSVWSNFTLAETTDASRPQIVEMELTRWDEWSNLTIGPAIRMFFYRDPLSMGSSRSIEGWLYLSYPVGPFYLFTNHSVDVLDYRGAYFGEAGIWFERRVSPRIELGGEFDSGWASSTFNDAWVGVDKSALQRISVEGWLTVYVKPHLYIAPHFEFSTIVDRAVRAEAATPTFFFFGLTTGVEF